MLKVIELFAGIGAQTQALKEANIPHEVIAISEIDKYALKAYEILHGKPNNLGDIKNIKKLPKADMWTYSFPCTDISLAGRLKGFEKGTNTKSSLLWEVERLLSIAYEYNELPKYLIMENVKNLISKKFKPNFDLWVKFLESLGYKNYYQVLNAKDYGIPQNRERVFMVSINRDEKCYDFPQKEELRRKLVDYLEPEVDEKYYLSERLINTFSDMSNRNGFIRGSRFRVHDENSEYAYTISTCPANRATDNFIMEPVIGAVRGRKFKGGKYEQNLEVNKAGVSNTITTVNKDNVVIVPENTKKGYAIAEQGDGIYTNRTHSKRGVVQKSKIPTIKCSVNDIGVVVNNPQEHISIRRLTPRECWRLMGWKDCDIDKVMNSNISNTQLYKMAGNSIVINCLCKILRNIKFNL
jgi:DNA (cytosine-5)-methyltransferase 1